VKHSSEKEIFWKVLIWRIVFSIPLSMLINYIYFHSIKVVIGMTIVSNIIGYIAHFCFELGWPKIWKIIVKKDQKNIEETK
jgi:hypothetical protein